MWLYQVARGGVVVGREGTRNGWMEGKGMNRREVWNRGGWHREKGRGGGEGRKSRV